jgi:hypothetical protein
MSAERIRELNDQFRRTYQGGKVMMTSGINALPASTKSRILEKVRTFDAFSKENDPHHEHDFGEFEEGGHMVFLKLDYHDGRWFTARKIRQTRRKRPASSRSCSRASINHLGPAKRGAFLISDRISAIRPIVSDAHNFEIDTGRPLGRRR